MNSELTQFQENNTELFYNKTILEALKEQGCIIGQDEIVRQFDGSYVCYHQMTIQEVMTMATPLFIIFLLIIIYLSYNLILPYMKSKVKEMKEK